MTGFGDGLIRLLVYFAIAAAFFISRVVIKIPHEIFRKILHTILLGSLLVFVFGFATWQQAAIASIGFALVVYPILAFFERMKGYSELSTERRKGELKESLLFVFFMFALVIAICWGVFHDRYLVLGSIYAWGFGDAAAALVGKKWGRHKIQFGHVDHHKSYEGSGAMFALSLVSVWVILLLRGGLGLGACTATAFVTALVSTVAELYSKGGHDTFICPLSAMVVLLPLVHLMGGGI